MTPIIIYPERLKQFGSAEGCAFCLVTNSELVSHFKIDSVNNYALTMIIPYDKEQKFSDVLKEKIPDKAHILVITPHCYFRSPKPEDLGNQRKLVIMANNSTPTSLEAIEHFLRCGEQTEPEYLDRVAEKFFDLAENTQQFCFVDNKYQTKAFFNHTSDKLQWHQQAGRLDWGQQQLFPSGEISTLPLDVYDMDIATSFELNGEITFQGYPVLHSGKASYLPADQERIFQQLSLLQHYPVIAVVEEGIIKEIKPTETEAEPLIYLFNALFELDSRYRTIIEIGFGINHWLKLFEGNSAMNEVYSASSGGTIHWGIGLTPFTQYHLDLICPNTSVLNKKSEIIFGKNNTYFTNS